MLLADDVWLVQILTAAFDDFNEFEMNATCYQVRFDRPYPSVFG